MNFLTKLKNSPIIGPPVKSLMKFVENKKVKIIAKHFSEYLRPVLATTEEVKEASFRIRHEVYCKELHFEPENPNQLETDDFDQHSLHCVIQHKGSGTYAGTVRIVYSQAAEQQLPIEKYCQEAIGNEGLLPKNFSRDKICEISRLAVPASFRKRSVDKFGGAATGVINENIYSEKEMRCFPFIAVGLYLSATAILNKKGIEHCFVMMEPRLARSLRFVGIPFEQIGPVVNYHGKRAPYHVDPAMVAKTVSPGFGLLLDNIDKELRLQLQ